MSVQAILAPVFALVLLTFVLLFWMGRERFASVRAGEVKPAEGSPRGFGWRGRAQQVSDCFHHQLELPVFFYVAVTLALVTKTADLAFVLLSWIFVALRVLHAVEHTGPNRILRRFRLFLSGALVLVALWLWFGLKLFTAL